MNIHKISNTVLKFLDKKFLINEIFLFIKKSIRMFGKFSMEHLKIVVTYFHNLQGLFQYILWICKKDAFQVNVPKQKSGLQGKVSSRSCGYTGIHAYYIYAFLLL